LTNTLLELYIAALETAALLVLPVVTVVALVGIVVGLAQSITGVADQNLSFGPKVASVMLMAALGGPSALLLLETLLRHVVRELPFVVH
jgi:flagellar biosynthesis protein FliQ